MSALSRYQLRKDLLNTLRERLPERNVEIVCLGIGRPFHDKTAQIQLALLCYLSNILEVCLRTRIQLETISDNLGQANFGVRPLVG